MEFTLINKKKWVEEGREKGEREQEQRRDIYSE